MLQQPSPDDFVIATGQQRSVRDFATIAAAKLGIELVWRGSGLEETGVERGSGRVLVRVDPRYFRPAEVDSLLGDASKARRQLGWEPSISFEELVGEMVEADLELARRDALVKRKGFKVFSRHE
jgi:GDPmannose 4,6-dehydratase